MALSRQEVEWVAHLARIELSEETAQKMATQLTAVLDYIAKLNQLDTSAVEPMSHPGAIVNVFRPDEPTASIERELALKNAPEHHQGFFKVPRVIE